MSELHPELARVILTPEEIEAKVAEMAAQISKDYQGKGEVYLVGILKGAFVFLADLARKLTIPHRVDFMAVSSYGLAGATSGAVRIVMDLRESIVDKHVLIVEDIVDSGHTLSYLLKTLKSRGPASVKTCVFLHKKKERLIVPLDYEGYQIPDVWVVGYGLDFAEMHRTLPYVAELDQEAIKAKQG